MSNGKYRRQVDEFGEGSFGKVFEGECVETGGRVCLKRVNLAEEGLSSEQRKEIAIWSTLDHENVAHLRDWFVEEVSAHLSVRRYLWLVSDLFELGSLRRVLSVDEGRRSAASREGRAPDLFLTRWRVVEVATGVLSGLNFLHTRSPPIIHRDLKPENVCLGEFKKDSERSISPERRRAAEKRFPSTDVRIIDFGASLERFEALNSSKSLRNGTLVYMGPQRVSRRGHSGQADDCWAAGLLIAECLLGEGIAVLFPSVREASSPEIPIIDTSKLPCEQVEQVERVIQRCEAVDERVGRVVRGLLTFDEAHRWTSGRALAELEVEPSKFDSIHLREVLMRTAVLEEELRRAEARAATAEDRAIRAESIAQEARRMIDGVIENTERSKEQTALIMAQVRNLSEELKSAVCRFAADDRIGGELRPFTASVPSRKLFRYSENGIVVDFIQEWSSIVFPDLLSSSLPPLLS